MPEVNDVLVPGVGRYTAIKHYRVNASILVEDDTVTYTALFDSIPGLIGVAAMVKDASGRMLEVADNMANLNTAGVTQSIRKRAYAYRSLAKLILTRDAWPGTVTHFGAGTLALHHADYCGSVALSEDYSWSFV